MKYSRSSSKFTGSAAFYIIIAVCLLIIGGASWFALSNYNNKVTDKDDQSESQLNSDNLNDKAKEYKDKTSSYIESIPKADDSAAADDVAKSVTDEPYTSSENTTAASDTFTMPVQGEIIKTHSLNELQYSATYGDMRIHSGIDISCEVGTAVSACAKGTVVSVEDSASLGTTVTIDHGNGITVKYSALDKVTVKAQQNVSAGDIIGNVAAVPAECADQSHLHLEVLKNGNSADPLATLGLN